jgi:hypothetical protein
MMDSYEKGIRDKLTANANDFDSIVANMLLHIGGQAEEITKLRQQLAKPAVEWMPIESAPKDGTEILLCTLNPVLPDIGLCYWRDDNVMTGWTWGLGHGFTNPTHWQPLPNPPAAYDALQDK